MPKTASRKGAAAVCKQQTRINFGVDDLVPVIMYDTRIYINEGDHHAFNKRKQYIRL